MMRDSKWMKRKLGDTSQGGSIVTISMKKMTGGKGTSHSRQDSSGNKRVDQQRKNQRIMPKKKISIASKFKLNKELDAKKQERNSSYSSKSKGYSIEDSDDITRI